VTRLLGIDLGERRIGVALGDQRTGSARPLLTFSRRDVQTDAATLARLAREHDAQELVVGLPLSLDGSEGPQAERTRAWAAAVAPLCGLLVSWQDERHTSLDAEQRVGGPGRGRAGGAPSPAAMRAYRARIDREAATAITQAAMDARRKAATLDVVARP
jgi:putative Holliday junction resolvase